MTKPPLIDIIVLAAGASTRFGAPKQLIRYNGMSLLRRTVETVLCSKAHAVSIVLGYEAEKMKLEIVDLPAKIIINPQWQNGISESIRRGIQSLGQTTDAAIIVLCDQPKLSTDILNTLIDTYTATHASIVTCKYAGTVGVPTLYDRCFFTELLALRGDRGAKSMIERYATQRIEIDFSGGENDIDTVADQGKLK